MAVEYPNELLTFLLGTIALLSIIVGVFRWKIVQIQNDTKRRVSTFRDTDENHKEINRINERYISFEARLADLEKEVSTLRGAFDQHNRESGK